MTNYIVSSNDKITLDELLKKINKNNDSEIVYYDLIDTSIDTLINDLNTYNLFATKKIIIGIDALFLSKDKAKFNVEHNLDNLLEYLNNPSDINTLILVSLNLDTKKKIVSEILKKVTLIEEVKNIEDIIKNRLNEYKIDNKTINYLINRCSNNNERILNEIDKLILYKLDNKEITITDINEIVKEDIDDNIFHFVDSILNGNKKEAFKMYNNFILNGYQIPAMLTIISNKVRLFYQVLVLSENGLSVSNIASKLKVHEYPVKLAYQQIRTYNKKKLTNLLKQLADLDLSIKSGETTGNVEFETLLASI